MNTIVTIATGGTKWGNMALNLAMSIKANSPEQKVGLIYTQDAVDGIEQLVNDFFDYGTMIYYDSCKTPQELAFKTKTQLYELCEIMCPYSEAFIFMDADTIVLPSKKVENWFAEHKDLVFNSYCNDVYYYANQKRKRKDYTFWCDPEQAKRYYGLHPHSKLPQINSSFLYWKKSQEAHELFRVSQEVYAGNLDYIPYKDAKPDELCFNIACAITGTYPSKTTYRPIFFSCFSETHSAEYINHYFIAFGFAGNVKMMHYVYDLYNAHSKYYREHFGVLSKFSVLNEADFFQDETPLDIHPFRRGTLYRSGEINNSDGGIFNPDGLVTKEKEITIFRKEVGLDAYGKYKKSTAIPHVKVLTPNSDTNYELELIGYEDGVRLEDFRLFMCNGTIMCNHSLVIKNNTENMTVQVNLAYINKNLLCNLGVVNLPIQTSRCEKNWAFFAERDTIYCVYSLSPYLLFASKKESGWQIWEKVGVESEPINFVHDKFICNSTNPILIDGEYLMFFHTKENGRYYHGAVLIDAETKQIKHYTQHTIPVKARNDGMHKGLHYISGAVYLHNEDMVRVFYGENDSHACYMDYKRDLLISAIKGYANSQL